MNGACLRKEFESAFDSYEQSIASAAGSVATDFNRFFDSFRYEDRLARAQRRRTTPNLSVLRVFGLTTRELRHSDALAWFLREDAEHEQGDLFMRTLLELVGLSKPSRLGDYTVDREKPEKVDIAAHKPGKFAVFIENKIQDRQEEERQFERLVGSMVKFSQKNKIPEDAQFPVFLTDDGRPPVTASELSRNITRVELFGAFAKALDAAPAKSPLLSQLLDNYLREIKRLV